jgi:hypothetical protein
MKDLIDIALVAAEPSVQPASTSIMALTVREALDRTFTFRRTHPVPVACPPPPVSWAARYPRDKHLNELTWPTIDDVHAEAARFLDPVLAKTASGVWDPVRSVWSEPDSPKAKKLPT